MLLFNWIGNQLYNTIAEQFAEQTSGAGIAQEQVPGKIPTCHMPFYVKEIDSDDLLEFTSSQNNPGNEIIVHVLNSLLPDRATSENRHVSYKFFNGEYYGKPDSQLSKYSGFNSSTKLPDRYLLKIPTVFLSTNAHPPQYPG
jgi:hypothetical protein